MAALRSLETLQGITWICSRTSDVIIISVAGGSLSTGLLIDTSVVEEIFQLGQRVRSDLTKVIV